MTQQVSAAEGERPLGGPRIQVLSVRHPDYSTVTRVFLDGKEIEDYEIDNIDPGAGYEAEDYRERLDDAKEAAAGEDATDYDRAYLKALEDMRDQFRKYAYADGDEWDAIVDAPNENEEQG